jgi:membrane-associated phospholipid phosphatase
MKYVFLSLFLFFTFSSFSQGVAIRVQKQSRRRPFFHSPASQFIIPAMFITYGVLNKVNGLQGIDYGARHEVNKHPNASFPYDDYIQYLPAAAVYGVGYVGVKAKHNVRDRTLIMATSYLIEAISVNITKNTTRVRRPDNSNSHSFPSGHTATAFVGAHILFKEYKDISPWIGIAGYGVATATGAMRVLNNKHWVSDVVAGAGLGILCVEMGYMLLPVWHNVLKVKEKGFAVTPVIGYNSYGAGLVYTF